RRVLLLVRADEALRVGIEGVAVVHQELAPAHQPEARADLVAELRPDLIQRERQLAVRGDAGADHRGDALLGGRREAVLPALAVLQVEEELLPLVACPAPALLPQLAGLEDRHLDLERSGAVDLLAHDRLGLAVGTQAERGQRVDPARDAADHPRAGEQDVRDRVGVAGHLADGLKEVLGPAHFERGKIPERAESREKGAASRAAEDAVGLPIRACGSRRSWEADPSSEDPPSRRDAGCFSAAASSGPRCRRREPRSWPLCRRLSRPRRAPPPGTPCPGGGRSSAPRRARSSAAGTRSRGRTRAAYSGPTRAPPGDTA